MKTLEELDRRIASLRDLQSIVRTMKALSAASIRQYENAVVSLDDYNRTIQLGFQVLFRRVDVSLTMPLPEAGSLAAVVYGSDYGLCGRFNEGVTAFAVKELGRRLVPGERLRILAVGARAADRLEALGYSVDICLVLPGSAKGLTTTIETILVTLDDWRSTGGVAQVILLHDRRRDQAAANPVIKQLLPVDMEQISEWALKPWPSRCLPTFTMDPIPLLSSLVRQFLFVTLYQAAAESLASEHASRLASMQTAERNIREHLEEMMREFRQTRQQLITEELLDLVAGYEVLEGANT